MLYFLAELKLLIAHLAEELNLQNFLLNEAVDFHAIRYPDSASWAIR
jgi:hypothetical protein